MSEQIAQHVVGVPAPRLRPFVVRYTGYRYEGAARPSFGAVAAAAGYADQAHMNRDWRELAGASPGAWLAAEQLPGAQLGADDPDAPLAF